MPLVAAAESGGGARGEGAAARTATHGHQLGPPHRGVAELQQGLTLVNFSDMPAPSMLLKLPNVPLESVDVEL